MYTTPILYWFIQRLGCIPHLPNENPLSKAWRWSWGARVGNDVSFGGDWNRELLEITHIIISPFYGIYIYLCIIYIYTYIHMYNVYIYIYLHIYLGGCLEQPISWGTPACRIYSSHFWTTGMVGVHQGNMEIWKLGATDEDFLAAKAYFHPANRWQFYAWKEHTVVASGNTLFPV